MSPVDLCNRSVSTVQNEQTLVTSLQGWSQSNSKCSYIIDSLASYTIKCNPTNQIYNNFYEVDMFSERYN